jgi:predicted SAM-dependent methyltransferase
MVTTFNLMRQLITNTKTYLRRMAKAAQDRLRVPLMKRGFWLPNETKINIGSGGLKIAHYFGLDVHPQADLTIDLESQDLPFPNNSMEVVTCISTINYFGRERGQELIVETYRILKPGGIARFGVQDLEAIAGKYVQRDAEFFFQKLPDGRERFRGTTMADKINSWFYGYETTRGKHGKYFYDFETLALLFQQAGFTQIEKMGYRESRLDHIDQIDNRADQMFFLEAVK